MDIIYIDGSTTDICVIIGHEIVIEPAIKGKEVTVNQGEYYALLKALQLARNRRMKEVLIFSDSQLIVNQLTPNSHGFPIYACKDKKLQPLNIQARNMIDGDFDKVVLAWIEREDNLAGMALEKMKR